MGREYRGWGHGEDVEIVRGMKAGLGDPWACTLRGTGFQRTWEVSRDCRAGKERVRVDCPGMRRR